MSPSTLSAPIIPNFVNGTKSDAAPGKNIPVTNPATGAVIAHVPLSGPKEVADAVRAASAAFPVWSGTPIKERAQVFYRYKTLMEKHAAELAALVQEENGKTTGEAMAEVEKSIEVTEFACSMPQLTGGEILEVSRGVECRIDRHPLGVVASITPFNFPMMVPNWTIPNAIVLGNVMILKPSELVPLSSMRLAELLKEAGLPDGVLNIVHGGDERLRRPTVYGGFRDGRRRERGPYYTPHLRRGEENRAGEKPGRGDLAAGEGADRAVHYRGGARRRLRARGRPQHRRQGDGGRVLRGPDRHRFCEAGNENCPG